MRFKNSTYKENRNQTYAIYSSIGKQNQSKKKTEPAYKFGKIKKQNKIGYFPDPKMPSQPRLNLPHAKY
jgi:hypothetical protein